MWRLRQLLTNFAALAATGSDIWIKAWNESVTQKNPKQFTLSLQSCNAKSSQMVHFYIIFSLYEKMMDTLTVFGENNHLQNFTKFGKDLEIYTYNDIVKQYLLKNSY